MSIRFPLPDFTDRETPFYFYDMKLLRETISAALQAASVDPRFRIEYAVKANDDEAILRMMAESGLGADCVSIGEINAAVKAAIPASKITYAGVGKTDRELIEAMHLGVCLNVESLPELEVISELATERGLTARVALRVNPDIDAHTHHYITTGLAENKFGINLPLLDGVVDKALALPGVKLTGLHFHIGSQITIADPFRILAERASRLVAKLSERGVQLESVNFGGGLGVDYDNPDTNPIPDFEMLFSIIHRHLTIPEDMEVKFELGRSLVAQCGSLITRVLYVKEGEKKRFVIVDGGMTDLIRPALYGAHHAIQNLSALRRNESLPTARFDVVGPICESADCFATDEPLPATTRRGDIVALRSAGAYGRVMGSTYNGRPLTPIFRKF